MRAATLLHSSRGLILGLAFLGIALATVLSLRQAELRRKQDFSQALVSRLVNADTTQVPTILGEIPPYRRWFDPLAKSQTDAGSGELHRATSFSIGSVAIRRRPAEAPPRKHAGVATGPHRRCAKTTHVARRRIRRWLVGDGQFVKTADDSYQRNSLPGGFLTQRQRTLGTGRRPLGETACYTCSTETPLNSTRWFRLSYPSAIGCWKPLLKIHVESPPDSEVATQWLARLAHDDSQLLIRVIPTATDAELSILVEPLKNHRDATFTELEQQLQTDKAADSALDGDPLSSQAEMRLANDCAHHVFDSASANTFGISSRQRAIIPVSERILIHRLRHHEVTFDDLLAAYRARKDPTTRQAILLALGHDEADLSAAQSSNQRPCFARLRPKSRCWHPHRREMAADKRGT